MEERNEQHEALQLTGKEVCGWPRINWEKEKKNFLWGSVGLTETSAFDLWLISLLVSYKTTWPGCVNTRVARSGSWLCCNSCSFLHTEPLLLGLMADMQIQIFDFFCKKRCQKKRGEDGFQLQVVFWRISPLFSLTPYDRKQVKEINRCKVLAAVWGRRGVT